MSTENTTTTAALEQPTNTPAADAGHAIEVANSKRAHDVDTLVEFADKVNSIYIDTKSILANYNYPPKNLVAMAEAVSETNRLLSIAATYILNPDATEIADGIRERIQARIDCGID